MRIAVAAALLCAAAFATGCEGKSAPEVRVFAASSLTDVMQTLAADYEKETGTKVVLNCASSSTLAHQIVEGAPCDLFLSADEEWAEFVAADGVRSWSAPEVLLTNRMVVVLAEGVADRFYGIPRDLADLDSGEYSIRRGLAVGNPVYGRTVRRIAVGDPEHVPAGRYARKGLENLGIWDSCRDRLVPCDSVRAALALVRRGEADAAIVYATDVRGSGLAVVEPPVAVINGSGGPPEMALLPGVEARIMAVVPLKDSATGPAFLDWLRGPRGRTACHDAGFGIPGEER